MGIIWNSSNVTEGLATTQAAHAGAMAHLKELLDEYHGVPRSESYYDLVAGAWLNEFIHLVYASWQYVLSGKRVCEGQPLKVAGDLLTYTQFTLDRHFHECCQSAVKKLLSGGSPFEWRFGHDNVRAFVSTGDWRRKILTNTLGSNRPSVIFCYPYVKCSRLDWLNTLWQWRHWAKWDDFRYPVHLSCQIDQDWRRTRAVETTPVRDFSTLLRALLPLHIPVALLEGFASVRKAVLGLQLWRPRALYTANALHGHLIFKILAAEWRAEGTVLLNHQHGGGYGIDRVHVVEEYETRVADRFYSWGWQRSDRPVQPLSPAIPSLGKGRRSRVLFMCCSFPAMVYRLHFQPMPGTTEVMERNTTAFLAKLSTNTDLLVRLNPAYNYLKFKKSLQVVAPWAAFDESRPSVFQRYAESRLVVHNYLGTSWLETLAMDIPTVCFFDQDTYAFRAEAQPYIEAMERVGILHRSALEAARFVAGVMAAPQGWWRKAEVQDARQAFVRQYANFSSDWAAQWEAEFRQWVQ